MPTAAATTLDVRVQTPEAFEFLYAPPLGSVRYRVAYGGRGGAKSWSFGRAALLHGMARPLRVLCAREYQNSIRDSVHHLLRDQVNALGLDAFYAVEQARIYGANGTSIIFHGLRRDPHTIKSLEGVNLCWVEEAHAISAESWQLLVPTIRAEGSEIWATFNPDAETDPLYDYFVTSPPASAIVRKVGWQDNPFLSEALRLEREEMLRRDPEAEAHVWGGEPWQRTDAQVFGGRYSIEEFEAGAGWEGPYYGADWGFAQDPSCLYRAWIFDSRLWVDYEARGVGWSMARLDSEFRKVPGADEHTIRADAARPETINELKLRGLKVVAAKKWPGSVEDGIEYLRSYEGVVIHPRCPGAAQDARLYRYKTDSRTGDVLPALVDAHNHFWDAIRYALAPVIRKRRRGVEVLA